MGRDMRLPHEPARGSEYKRTSIGATPRARGEAANTTLRLARAIGVRIASGTKARRRNNGATSSDLPSAQPIA